MLLLLSCNVPAQCFSRGGKEAQQQLVLVHHNDDDQGRMIPVERVHADPKGAFDMWMTSLDKIYDTVEEYEERFVTWFENFQFVVDYNSKHDTHWLGMTRFADMSHEEWKEKMGFKYITYPKEKEGGVDGFRYAGAEVETPERVDWRERGAVGPVKNQQMCGSCWAFSTTGSIEGVNAIVTGTFTSLSEQMLVDCDTSRDHGCHGGLMDFAFDFVKANGGIDTEDSYPYKGEEGTCDVGRRDRHVVTIDGHEDVPANDEKALKKAVAHQPVSVAIEADQKAFQLYVGGVFDGECGTELNHGVLVVGYGKEYNGTEKMPYWLIKNSWGPEWGDKGYIRIARNSMNSEGQCGVAMQASYPVKTGPNPPEPPPAPPAPPPTPPAPEPVDCDGTVSCPGGSTCCCMRELFGFCYTWACCPMPDAVCCDDLVHCCPKDLPVCNVEQGTCSKGISSLSETVPIVSKIPATKKKSPFRPPTF